MRIVSLLLLILVILPAVYAQNNTDSDNLAQDKLAWASSIENESHRADFAVDGASNTRWSSEYADGQWLAVDLNAIYRVEQVVLDWEAAYGAVYHIDAWDGNSWQTVFTEDTGDGGTDEIILPDPVVTRYIRFGGVQRGTEWGFSLWEFEVYGVAVESGGTELETPPDDTPVLVPNSESETALRESAVVAVHTVTPLEESVAQYDKLELVADIEATFNNPYDPNDIRVDGQFETPYGERIVVPAFYYRDYDYANGSLNPTDDWSWRVRFTPTETGEYRYRVLATTANGSRRSNWQTIIVTPSDVPGFIRIDPRNPRYFAFDDGTPYFPVGENMAWSRGQDPIADYTLWLDALEAHGGNFIRTWMATWGFSIEWADTGLGNYDNRQDRAYQLDTVLDLLAERDIYMMLTLLNHGQFNEQTNPEWDTNPFNAANGGMLERPEDFATNPEARRLWNQRLRYIAARWGYSPNIMAWEWWNEVNWTPLVNSELLSPWMSSSAAYLDSLDPYDRLMTHSGSPVGDGSIWNADHMDFTQAHLYNMSDLPLTFGQVIPDWLETYPDKPFLMGEFGSPIELDTEGVLLHLGLWSAPMKGAAGTGMFWWWDTYIHPNDLYYHFEGVAAFYAEEDLAAYNWRQADLALTEDARARAYGLQTDDSALVWVVSTDYSDRFLRQQYNRNLRNGVENPEVIEFPVVDGAVLTITGLQQGTYAVEIWDTLHGEIMETTSVTVTDGMLAIPLPAFTLDHAIKIRRGA